jgi:hypothetical protein
MFFPSRELISEVFPKKSRYFFSATALRAFYAKKFLGLGWVLFLKDNNFLLLAFGDRGWNLLL